MWWRRLAEVQTEHQNGEERGLSDSERGMVVGADGLVWVFDKLLIYWDFHTQPSLGFTENGPKKRKYPVSGSCVDENALLIYTLYTFFRSCHCSVKIPLFHNRCEVTTFSPIIWLSDTFRFPLASCLAWNLCRSKSLTHGVSSTEVC